MTLIDVEEQRQSNPVDVIEQIAALNDWAFERAGDDEITIAIEGGWAEYQVSFSWLEEREAIHLACAFDLKVPDRRRAEAAQLVARINEQLWVGHFDVWSKDGVVMFRHAMLLAGNAQANDAQCEAVMANALEACERYYQAFQFVVWAGKSTAEALEGAMFDTIGEA